MYLIDISTYKVRKVSKNETRSQKSLIIIEKSDNSTLMTDMVYNMDNPSFIMLMKN